MKIQIVYPSDGWILQKLGRTLCENIEAAVGNENYPDTNTEFDITYFVNYALYKPQRRLFRPSGKPENTRFVGGFFTHFEGERFARRARQMDFCICPCRKSLIEAKRYNKQSFLVYHGIDMKRYRPKLRLGFVGRVNKGGRKGEDLFSVLQELDFVELRACNGAIPERQMPGFYQSLDYVFIPSRIEGGPLCFQEGLASGKEIISTDVGMVADFKKCEGIHIFDRNNPEQLKNLLRGLFEKKLCLRRIVEEYTTDYFAAEHLKVFESILSGKRNILTFLRG